MENNKKASLKIFVDPKLLINLINTEDKTDIDEFAKISDDGKSLFIRVPAKIKSTFNIQKGQYLQFHSEVKNNKKGELKITIINEDQKNQAITTNEKNVLDYKDKIILKAMLTNGCNDNRWLTTNEIKTLTKLNWKTVNEHLKKLNQVYPIESKITGEERNYKREGKKVKSQRQKEWKFSTTQTT